MGSAPASLASRRVAIDVDAGETWSIDATGLDPSRLAGKDGLRALRGLFDELIETMDLHPVAAPIWHVFPGPHAGVTGIVALSESHLACHSFPEHGGLTLDLYTCKRRTPIDWHAAIGRHAGRADLQPTLKVTRRSRAFGKATQPEDRQ